MINNSTQIDFANSLNAILMWLFPVYVCPVAFLLIMARNIEDWLPETGKPNLKMIVYIIFIVNFLSATQDIAVDGWSLTMLKKWEQSRSDRVSSRSPHNDRLTIPLCRPQEKRELRLDVQFRRRSNRHVHRFRLLHAVGVRTVQQ